MQAATNALDAALCGSFEQIDCVGVKKKLHWLKIAGLIATSKCRRCNLNNTRNPPQ